MRNYKTWNHDMDRRPEKDGYYIAYVNIGEDWCGYIQIKFSKKNGWELPGFVNKECKFHVYGWSTITEKLINLAGCFLDVAETRKKIMADYVPEKRGIENNGK